MGELLPPSQAVRRHLVRLQRDAPDMQRLGFGNVVAGPPHAPANCQDDVGKTVPCLPPMTGGWFIIVLTTL